MRIPTISNTTAFYSPFSFIRKPDLCAGAWIKELISGLKCGQASCFEGGLGVYIYYRNLKWDSKFFGIQTYRVDYTLVLEGTSFSTVESAFKNFRDHLHSMYPEYYLFAEVPSEDTAVLSGMCGAGWRLIETRITHFRDNMLKFEQPKKVFSVRNATEADIPELRQVAMLAVNRYDRFHADEFFTPSEANSFLSVYIENSVKGLADEVLVPASGQATAFITGKYISPPFLAGQKFGQIVLSATTPSHSQKGLYAGLVGAMSLKFKEHGADMVFMTTQTTNRSVLRVCHFYGYQFGKCTHILSVHHRKK